MCKSNDRDYQRTKREGDIQLMTQIQNIRGLGPVFVSLGYTEKGMVMGIDVDMEDKYSAYLFNLQKETSQGAAN